MNENTNQQNPSQDPSQEITIGYLLGRIWRRKVRDNKSTLVLLVCFIIVVAWWFLQQLQNGQIITTTLAPTYTELPAGYSSSEVSRESITISVKMNNFNILSYLVGELPIEIDMSAVVEKKNGQHFWVPSKFQDVISAALHDGDELEKIKTDTIFFNMGDETVKKISVYAPDISIKPRSGYEVFAPVMISPTQVKVIGPKNEIDAIEHINLPAISLRGIIGEVHDTIRLSAPEKYRRLYFSPEEVVITAIAEAYTEETVTLHIFAVNAPRGRKVHFIPSQVKVKYHVPLKNYGSVSEKDFRIEADLSSRNNKGENIVYLRLVSKPSCVGRVDIIPEKVYYLIK